MAMFQHVQVFSIFWFLILLTSFLLFFLLTACGDCNCWCRMIRNRRKRTSPQVSGFQEGVPQTKIRDDANTQDMFEDNEDIYVTKVWDVPDKCSLYSGVFRTKSSPKLKIQSKLSQLIYPTTPPPGTLSCQSTNGFSWKVKKEELCWVKFGDFWGLWHLIQ